MQSQSIFIIHPRAPNARMGRNRTSRSVRAPLVWATLTILRSASDTTDADHVIIQKMIEHVWTKARVLRFHWIKILHANPVVTCHSVLVTK